MFYIGMDGDAISRFAYRWLLIISLVSCVNSLLLFFFDPSAFVLFSMLLPFISAFLFDVMFWIISIINMPRLKNNAAIDYISQHYSDIYERIYPHGRHHVYNGIEYIKFLMGKYDDGRDSMLQTIKSAEKNKIKLIAWAHVLIPAVWGVNILIIKFK